MDFPNYSQTTIQEAEETKDARARDEENNFEFYSHNF
jgi:hypothetical protein